MSKSITLSEEESNEIVEMMKENQKGAPKQQPQTSKEVKKEQKNVKQQYNQIKKLLKSRSKTELIELVWTYGVELNSMQHAAQILLEENKQLKARLGVESEDEKISQEND